MVQNHCLNRVSLSQTSPVWLSPPATAQNQIEKINDGHREYEVTDRQILNVFDAIVKMIKCQNIFKK